MAEPALVCAVCLFIRPPENQHGAATVMYGFAACKEHFPYMRVGESFTDTLKIARGNEDAARTYQEKNRP